jgi:hypothetical protein
MLLPTETRKRLGDLFTTMVDRLLADKDPDGFAVAAAMGIVVFAETVGMVGSVAAALVQQIEAHRVSVEDLIAELQAVADAQGKGAPDVVAE